MLAGFMNVDTMLDSEDSLIVMIDGGRAISLADGFGLSPCQLELVTIEIERAVRAVAGTKRFKKTERRTSSEHVNGLGNCARVREHLGGDGCRYDGGVADRKVRVVGLVILPTAVVAALLVLYFDWRARLQRSILADRDERDDWDEAA